MAGLELMPFADEHVEAAAALLAARHARHRAAEPLLPAAYEDSAAARGAVEEAWQAEGASGAVALRDGAVVGYLVGAPRSPSWGPNVWVEIPGHAVEEAETVRDLYAAAAGVWVDAGATRHYALVPSTDTPLVDAWFRLSFGQQHALGIREVPAEPTAVPDGIVVRRAGPEDVDVVIELDILAAYQAGAPTFSDGPPRPDPAEERADVEEELADENSTLLLAELEGRAVGMTTAAPVERSGMHTGLARPDGAGILGYAATLPEVRGSGVGLALTEGVYTWAREHGYGTIVVDWRVTNLLSSRFWSARGFRTTFLRLYRSIP